MCNRLSPKFCFHFGPTGSISSNRTGKTSTILVFWCCQIRILAAVKRIFRLLNFTQLPLRTDQITLCAPILFKAVF